MNAKRDKCIEKGIFHYMHSRYPHVTHAFVIFDSIVAYILCDLRFIIPYQVVCVEQRSNKSLELTDEGKTVSANGSHEALVYNAIPADGILQAELMVNIIFSSSFIPAKMFVNCSQFRLKMYFVTLGVYSYKSEPGCIELD